MRKTIIAHRGASRYFPENTIEAFEKAIEMGADMIEFDVRKTKDGRLIIYHDEDFGNIKIRELDYEYLLKEKPEIPLLEDALEKLRGRIPIDIEIKENGYENEVINLVLRYFKVGEFIVTSFHDDSIRIIKDLHPEIRVGLLLGRSKPNNVIATRISELFPMRRMLKAKADFLVPSWKLLKFGFLQRANKNRIPLFVWGIKDKKAIISLLKKDGVEALIVDNLDDAISSNKSVL